MKPQLVPGAVNVGGEDAADALRVVGWERSKGQAVLCEQLHHVTDARAAFDG